MSTEAAHVRPLARRRRRVTFGGLFDEMPESDLAALIKLFRSRFDGTGEA